jgi:hypothetical protein
MRTSKMVDFSKLNYSDEISGSFPIYGKIVNVDDEDEGSDFEDNLSDYLDYLNEEYTPSSSRYTLKYDWMYMSKNKSKVLFYVGVKEKYQTGQVIPQSIISDKNNKNIIKEIVKKSKELKKRGTYLVLLYDSNDNIVKFNEVDKGNEWYFDLYPENGPDDNKVGYIKNLITPQEIVDSIVNKLGKDNKKDKTNVSKEMENLKDAIAEFGLKLLRNPVK